MDSNQNTSFPLGQDLVVEVCNSNKKKGPYIRLQKNHQNTNKKKRTCVCLSLEQFIKLTKTRKNILHRMKNQIKPTTALTCDPSPSIAKKKKEVYNMAETVGDHAPSHPSGISSPTDIIGDQPVVSTSAGQLCPLTTPNEPSKYDQSFSYNPLYAEGLLASMPNIEEILQEMRYASSPPPL